MVPSPITGGGGKIATKAPLIALLNSPLSAPVIAHAERSGVVRSLNGFSVTNTMPALELLVKPLMERPGKETA